LIIDYTIAKGIITNYDDIININKIRLHEE
jgi:hypothetical protein